ncbi:MAG: hypothetical protein IJV82_03685 [Oscillospiraceae bacterium]|nr:hypothetical protein [Oscillospiraceae bacterium]
MKLCNNCGAELQASTQICGGCGKRIDQSESSATSPLLRRARQFLEDSDWGKADDYCEQLLDQQPENAEAFVVKMMARLKVRNEQELGNAPVSVGDWNSYRNACRYADENLRKKLEGYLRSTEQYLLRREEEKIQQEEIRLQEAIRLQNQVAYAEACRLQRAYPAEPSLKEALQRFEKMLDYLDSAERARECRQRLEMLKLEDEQRAFEMEQAKKRTKRGLALAVAVVVLALIVVAVVVIRNVNESNADRQARIAQNLVGMTFEGQYSQISGSGSWGDAQTWYKYETTYRFRKGGEVKIHRITRYDEYPFITYNGVQQWESVTEDDETVRYGEVKVSFFGDVTVTIDGVTCKLVVDENDMPVSIEIDGRKFERQ